jgi:glucosamine--fructose-6-phosphate aminotransferase (isomerizing)
MTTNTRSEILSQAEAWTSALEAVRAGANEVRLAAAANRGREVRFIGSGSSYYLGLAAASTWSRTGWNARVLPSSEQLLNPLDYPSSHPPLVIAVTRSGSTTETVRAAAMLRREGSATIGISTQGEGPIADVCDVVIGVNGGRERSTVQTRSFTGQLVAAKALAFLVAGDEEGMSALEGLAPRAAEWIARAERRAEALAGTFSRAYLLGTGERWGLAHEAALKLKETALAEAEAFQTLEFRHGPQSMVDSQTLVIGLVGDDNREAELSVLREMKALGGRVLAIGEDLEDGGEIDTLSFRSGLPERARSPLYLAPLQLLACHRALRQGLDPDNPRNLTFAVQLAQL